MSKKMLSSKRKNTITNEQSKLIFDEMRPYISRHQDYQGELNKVHEIPDINVVINKEGFVTVCIDCSYPEMLKLNKISDIHGVLISKNFFMNQLRGMIMATTEPQWTNALLLDEFQKGMKITLLSKINHMKSKVAQ